MEQKLRNKVDIPLEQCLFCEHNKNFVDFEENLEHMFRTHGFYIPEQKFLVNKSGLVKYMSEKIGLGNVCIVCNFQGRTLTAVRQHMLAKRHCKIPYEIEDERLEISEFTISQAHMQATVTTQQQATKRTGKMWAATKPAATMMNHHKSTYTTTVQNCIYRQASKWATGLCKDTTSKT